MVFFHEVVEVEVVYVGKEIRAFRIKKLFLCACAVLCILSLCSCGKDVDTAVRIDRTESFFSTFRVENGLVYYECELLVQNTGDEDQTVTFEATDAASVKTGLLQNAQLRATERYFVPAKSTIRLRVTFVGEAGSELQKADRSLPDIKLVICG